MAIDWSDEIVHAKLTDEPALSEELSTLQERLGDAIEREQSDAPHLVLDFASVSYVNSSNIGQLLRLSKLMNDGGRQLRLCSLNDEVWSVMMVTGLEKVFRFSPDTLTALASIQIEQPGEAPGED